MSIEQVKERILSKIGTGDYYIFGQTFYNGKEVHFLYSERNLLSYCGLTLFDEEGEINEIFIQGENDYEIHLKSLYYEGYPFGENSFHGKALCIIENYLY